MYGGGPIIVRDDLDIYSNDLSRDQRMKTQASRGKDSLTRKRGASGNKNPNNAGNNIFAKATSPRNLNFVSSNLGNAYNKKKRNLFLSENIGIEDEDGIPEEHIEIQS